MPDKIMFIPPTDDELTLITDDSFLTDPGQRQDWQETKFTVDSRMVRNPDFVDEVDLTKPMSDEPKKVQEVSFELYAEVCVDGYLYHALKRFDVDPAMTYAFEWFRTYEWNGHVPKLDYPHTARGHEGEFSLMQFPAWYEFYVLQNEALSFNDYEQRPVDEDEVRAWLIEKRLTIAHNNPDRVQSKRIQNYLKDALCQIVNDDNLHFAVPNTNSAAGFFERDEQKAIFALTLLLDYALGGKGRPDPDKIGKLEEIIPNAGNRRWRDYLTTSNYNELLLVIGYILHICDKAVARTVKTNIRLNALQEQQVADYMDANRPSWRELTISGDSFLVGGHDHQAAPIHFDGGREFYSFEIEGAWYMACLDQSLDKQGIVPVLNIDHSGENLEAELRFPGGSADLYCRHCHETYEVWHSGARGLGDSRYWYNVEAAQDDLADQYDTMWENVYPQFEVGPTLPMFPGQVCQPDLHVGILAKYPLPVNFDDWGDNATGFDAYEDVIYCPTCRKSLQANASAYTDW